MELPLQSPPQADYQGNKMFKIIAQSAVKFVSETLSKYLLLKCSTKAAKDQLLSGRSEMQNYRANSGKSRKKREC